jgi:hypothetical protein
VRCSVTCGDLREWPGWLAALTMRPGFEALAVEAEAVRRFVVGPDPRAYRFRAPGGRGKRSLSLQFQRRVEHLVRRPVAEAAVVRVDLIEVMLHVPDTFVVVDEAVQAR